MISFVLRLGAVIAACCVGFHAHFWHFDNEQIRWLAIVLAAALAATLLDGWGPPSPFRKQVTS